MKSDKSAEYTPKGNYFEATVTFLLTPSPTLSIIVLKKKLKEYLKLLFVLRQKKKHYLKCFLRRNLRLHIL